MPTLIYFTILMFANMFFLSILAGVVSMVLPHPWDDRVSDFAKASLVTVSLLFVVFILVMINIALFVRLTGGTFV